MSARFRTRSGDFASVGAVVWTSNAPQIVGVQGTGSVVAVAAAARGTATIAVTAQAPSGAAFGAAGTVTVGDVTSVRITPDTLRLSVSATATLGLDVTADPGVPRTVTWSSTDFSKVTVNAAGVVTGVAPGVSTIRAVSTVTASVQGTSVVVVAPTLQVPASVAIVFSKNPVCAGRKVTATVTARDNAGAVIPNSGLSVAFTTISLILQIAPTSDPFVFEVTPTVAGSATLSARVTNPGGSAQGSGTLQALPPLQRVGVSLGSATLTAGQTTQATVAPLDCEGVPVLGKTATWASSNQAFATVSPTGLVTAVAEGTATITGTVDGVSGSATVTVSKVVDNIAQMVGTSAPTQPNETILAPVLDPPAVRLTRQSGAAAVGEVVTFTVSSGGGTVAPASSAVTTDNNGFAKLTSWTLGGTTGQQTVTATFPGLPATLVTFSATAGVPQFQQSAPSVCRAQLPCAFALTILDRRNQPLRNALVSLTPDANPGGSTFEHPQIRTDAQGYLSTTWFLPARLVYAGRATVGSVTSPISREAVMPDFSVGVIQAFAEKLQRGGTPVRVGGIVVRVTRQPAGPTYSSAPSDGTGKLDSGDLTPGVYDGEIPVSVGVVRAVRFYGRSVGAGALINLGSLRIPAGTAGGPVEVCLVGPLNTDPSTVVSVFDGKGGDGTEPGRNPQTFSAPNVAGCVTNVSLQEGEYTLKVQRTGRPDYFPTLVVDTNQFSPPAKFTITIP